MNDKEQFESVGEGLLVRAPAKINLSLLVAGQRADGFHELETIMAKVTWYDEILIEPGQKAGIELVCRGPHWACLLYTSPSPRDRTRSRMPSSA